MSRNNAFGKIAAMTYDAVFVGSGINSLAGAALLAREGWSVCVLERSDRPGGCIRTSSELTLPGFTHEVMASWHPLFTGSAAYAELKDELDRRGVEYINTDLPTGSAFPDGSAAFIATSLEANIAELDRFAAETGPPGSASSTSSWRMPISRSACSARSCGRAPASASAVPRTGAWGGAGSCSSPADPRQLPRLGHRDLRLGSGARPSGALGAAHGPRPGSGELRVHDAGDRSARCSWAACLCRRAAACASWTPSQES